MHLNNRYIQCGTSSVTALTYILGSDEDGYKGERLLRVGVSGL